MGIIMKDKHPVIAVIIKAIKTFVQKLRQKSQLNIFDTSFGPCSITKSLKPILVISNITKAERSAVIIISVNITL